MDAKDILQRLKGQALTDTSDGGGNNIVDTAFSDLMAHRKTLAPDEESLFKFLVHDQQPDMVKVFDSLRDIGNTRENESIKRRILNAVRIIEYSTGQLLNQIDTIYKENEELKKIIHTHRSILHMIAKDYQVDTGLAEDTLRIKTQVENQIKSLKKKGII